MLCRVLLSLIGFRPTGRTLGFLTLIAALTPGPALGQWACRRFVGLPRLGLTVSRAESDSVLQLINQLDIATWGKLREWYTRIEVPTDLFTPEYAEGLAEGLRVRVQRDSGLRRLVSLALSEMMRGEGAAMVRGQDVLAAGLYRYWHLSPDAALSLLANPLIDFRTRVLAVAALGDYWTEVRFYRASIGALCVLAARATALQALRGESEEQFPIDVDEENFLLSVERAFASAGEVPSDSLIQLIHDLPAGNPITEHVLRIWGRR